MNNNSGFVVLGGVVNAQQVALGDGASIVNHGPAGSGDLLAAIRSLEKAIADSGLQPGQRAELMQATAALAAESGAKQPSRTRLDEIVQTVQRVSGAIPAVAAGIVAVQTLVTRLFAG